MSIRTLILDDDANSRRAACTELSEFSEIEVVGQFSESSELFGFLESNSANLLFLDIELNEEMGFTVAQKLRLAYPEILIVFLTGHATYAIDGYDFQPVNFLTKPINKLKLEQTISEVHHRLNQQSGQKSAKLMFRLQKGYRIIDVRDICYIERLNRKNYLHTPSETLCIAGYTMSELEEMLEQHGFFLCHQSFLISLYRVKSVRDIKRQLYEAEIQDCSKPVPISRNCYVDLMKHLQNISANSF
ncbi:MAG: LytTR family DNA-binding domain-containing protein [Eubacterium sp.]|nr:LytTR family DNA-binding domain-containing protein [Eubacterium sp.]